MITTASARSQVVSAMLSSGGVSTGGNSLSLGQPLVGLAAAQPSGTPAAHLGIVPILVGCGVADVAFLGGSPGSDGQLTADDVVVYLAAFFANNGAIADVASLGGGQAPDGQLTADDVVVFLAAFFAGCG